MEKPLVTWARIVSEAGETIVEELVPEEARGHFRASLREALIGSRVILDSFIEQLGEDKPPAVRPRGKSARPAKTVEIEGN
ncbi:hypothetical protein KZ483_02710 [Paenibacillus sp. sptzw28]|uniref:hypothetical protein n=1 Tax=Paenibacillus sp. sptzw28 TaxID=715179 RepID=UPI001C6EA395|nr:hypothetical protein [Paenibacillus sp. sptzw28]QYR21965.1 hypothetical protein KZ483_02710 [Paenibacillus sp. sptzw28]